MAQVSTFHFVRLWQEVNRQEPTLQQRVVAPSEGQAVIQVMKAHHLHAAARVWVSRSATSEPTMRLVCVIVKGNRRSWKQELGPSGSLPSAKAVA
jgi:Holliday junction resolvase-like predicted endonuclease